ncbi:MAG: 6-pyruvoyl trahydropterin synthase family protein [Romboutsia timonensis]
MRITRHEEFETAHLLPGYDGGCGNLHGHSYKIEVTVEGKQDQPFDMVMDFKDLKKAIKEVIPDHRFVYYDGDEISCKIAKILDEYNLKYVRYPFYTTAENMVGYFAELIDNYIKNELGYKNVDVVEVKLWETTNSYATWKKPEQLQLNLEVK